MSHPKCGNCKHWKPIPRVGAESLGWCENTRQAHMELASGERVYPVMKSWEGCNWHEHREVEIQP